MCRIAGSPPSGLGSRGKDKLMRPAVSGLDDMPCHTLWTEQSAHRDNVALVPVGVGLQAGQQDAQRHLMAVGPMQWIAAVLGPAGLPIVPAQYCTSKAPKQYNESMCQEGC